MKIGVGIIGVGTVGTGVLEILSQRQSVFKDQLGLDLEVVGVSSRTPAAPVHPAYGCAWGSDPMALIRDERVQIVVELAGGYDAPRTWISEALQLGKHVVTANKALIAKYGTELLPLATSKGLHLMFEAAVGGGIPIIKAMQESLLANHIQGFSCIINGTCNYILTEMTQKGADFGEVLAQAQALGYAEADPTFDVDGIDASHKTAILASLAGLSFVDFESFPVEGIRGVAAADICFAKEMNCTIKLLGRVRQGPQGMDVRVQPFLIPETHLLANVNGVLNAVHLETDQLGPALLTGAGAGKGPTASAVVADLLHIARNLSQGQGGVARMNWFSKDNAAKLAPAGDYRSRYYLRMRARDEAGVLASIASTLGKHSISIESIVQKPVAGEASADLFVVTHECVEAEVLQAAQTLNQLGLLRESVQLIRFI